MGTTNDITFKVSIRTTSEAVRAGSASSPYVGSLGTAAAVVLYLKRDFKAEDLLSMVTRTHTVQKVDYDEAEARVSQFSAMTFGPSLGPTLRF